MTITTPTIRRMARRHQATTIIRQARTTRPTRKERFTMTIRGLIDAGLHLRAYGLDIEGPSGDDGRIPILAHLAGQGVDILPETLLDTEIVLLYTDTQGGIHIQLDTDPTR